jgi:hypothetical protein
MSIGGQHSLLALLSASRVAGHDDEGMLRAVETRTEHLPRQAPTALTSARRWSQPHTRVLNTGKHEQLDASSL